MEVLLSRAGKDKLLNASEMVAQDLDRQPFRDINAQVKHMFIIALKLNT